jgi:hypothetical protein
MMRRKGIKDIGGACKTRKGRATTRGRVCNDAWKGVQRRVEGRAMNVQRGERGEGRRVASQDDDDAWKSVR